MVKRLLAGLVALLVLMMGLQVQIDMRKKRLKEELARPFVPPRPQAVKVASLGYQTLLADAYWLRAIQYFAEASELGKPPNELYPMADFITDLDPRFCFAYYFTGLNLVVGVGKGQYVIDILEKGKRNCPEYWKIPFQLGWFYFYGADEYELAAENLERAYQLTGHKNFALLAARIRAQGGTPEVAIHFLTELIRGTEDPQARETYARRIDELRALQIINNLNRRVEQYHSIEGQYPRGVEDLRRLALLDRLPAHPVAGHRFVYLPDEHRFENEPRIYTGVFDVRKKGKK